MDNEEYLKKYETVMSQAYDNIAKTDEATKQLGEALDRLNEELEKENTLTDAELAIAHAIEDHIEDFLDKYYEKGKQAYTINLPQPASSRIHDFVNKRMYHWCVLPETETKWILRWQ